MPQPNSITINGVPFEFAIPSEIHILRGSQPYAWSFVVSDENIAAWKALANPLTIRIDTPGRDGNLVHLDLEKWYITSIEVDSGSSLAEKNGKLWRITIQDVRWKLAYNTFQANYNVRTLDRRYRYDDKSTGPPDRIWTVLDASADAIKKLGGVARIHPDAQKKYGSVKLPDNLGDSRGGGFTAGTLRDVEKFLEMIRCDMVPNEKGELLLVDRSTDHSEGILKDTTAYGGGVEPQELRWALPKLVRIQFEQRVERAFIADIDFSSTATAATPALKKHDLPIKNVVPVVDLNAFPIIDQAGNEIIEWREITTYVPNDIGVTMDQFLYDYFKDTGIPIGPGGLSDEAAERLRQKEDIARRSLFTTWRVDLDLLDVGRVWADMRFGRLGYDGNSMPGGYVFCDWTEITEYPYNNPQTIAEGKCSKIHKLTPGGGNVGLPNVELYGTESPFRATWVSDGRHDLVFQLDHLRLPAYIQEIKPGWVYPPMGFGDVRKLINGDEDYNFKRLVHMWPKFQMKVLWSGILASSVEGTERLYSEYVPAFPQGQIPMVTIKVDDITANWRLTDNGNVFPGTLINKLEIQRRAKHIADQVISTYSQAKSGVAFCDGIETLKPGITFSYWPAGNLYEAVIKIGTEKPWSINTEFVFLPDVRSDIQPETGSLDGQAPELIG